MVTTLTWWYDIHGAKAGARRWKPTPWSSARVIQALLIITIRSVQPTHEGGRRPPRVSCLLTKNDRKTFIGQSILLLRPLPPSAPLSVDPREQVGWSVASMVQVKTLWELYVVAGRGMLGAYQLWLQVMQCFPF